MTLLLMFILSIVLNLPHVPVPVPVPVTVTVTVHV